MKDVFGKILMAHHLHGSAEYVIERDDGYIDNLDAGEYFAGHDYWPEYERRAIEEARGRVLDVGVGAGRVASWLQEKGLHVIGIDTSPLALTVASLRGVKDCRLMDVRGLDFPDSHFDTVIMFGNNFGIAGDVKQTRGVMESLHRITTESGQVIASTRNPLETDNPAHLAYHERNRRLQRPPGLVKIRIGFEGEYDDWFELLMVGEDEMEDVVGPAGWHLKRTYRGNANFCAILMKN